MEATERQVHQMAGNEGTPVGGVRLLWKYGVTVGKTNGRDRVGIEGEWATFPVGGEGVRTK